METSGTPRCCPTIAATRSGKWSRKDDRLATAAGERIRGGAFRGATTAPRARRLVPHYVGRSAVALGVEMQLCAANCGHKGSVSGHELTGKS